MKEKTVISENLHRINIPIEKSHYILRHKILLSAIVYDIPALINILTSVFEHMVVEKVLNGSHKWAIILHLGLDRDSGHDNQKNR